MRTLMFMGLAASLAVAPVASESAPMAQRGWGSVPTIPLRPPVATTSGAGSWRGGLDRPQRVGRFRPRAGFFMPSFFVSPTYFVADWWSYGLAEPGYGQRWVRYYDDAVLIDRRGYIYDTAPGVDWGGYGFGPDGGYRDGAFDDRYEDDAVSWGSGTYYARPYRGPVYYAPAGTTTMIVQNPPTVTTTTTTFVEEVAQATPRKAWKPRPKRTWKPRPTCTCR